MQLLLVVHIFIAYFLKISNLEDSTYSTSIFAITDSKKEGESLHLIAQKKSESVWPKRSTRLRLNPIHMRLLCISREFLLPVNLCNKPNTTEDKGLQTDPNPRLFHFDTCPLQLRRRWSASEITLILRSCKQLGVSNAIARDLGICDLGNLG